jgi:hypothetical protein
MPKQPKENERHADSGKKEIKTAIIAYVSV